jgi:hypothetical protein
MIEAHSTRPLVRPGFLKWSVLAFALLLPVVVHEIWDYVEERRLAAVVKDLEQRGEPTGASRPASELRKASAETSEAERNYRAAAVLASNFRTETQPHLKGVAAASQSDQWPADVVTPMRSAIRRYDESLALADRAAGMPFEGFAPGASYTWLAANLLDVQQLSGYRAMVQALDGRADDAVDSLYTAVRLGRPLKPYAYSQRLVAQEVVRVLQRTKASAASLRRLGAAFDELDDDRELSNWFAETRRTDLYSRQAQHVSLAQAALATVLFVERPWATHMLNRQLETLTNLVTAAREPWPQRIDRVMGVGAVDIFPVRSSVPGVDSKDQGRRYLENFVLASASRTAGLRALRLVIALEQFRRDHAEQLPGSLEDLEPAYIRAAPVDPFSGHAFLLKRESDAYSVYSVGTNRRDDGAMDVNTPLVVGAFPAQYPADVGVRVQYR